MRPLHCWPLEYELTEEIENNQAPPIPETMAIILKELANRSYGPLRRFCDCAQITA